MTNALDTLDLSKEAALVGMDQTMAKDFVRAAVYKAVNEHADHVIFSWGFIHISWRTLKPALAMLIGPEPSV